MISNSSTAYHRVKNKFIFSEVIFGVLIVLLGLFLRLWQIGKQPFWLDELGVAQIAFKPALFDALKAVNDHVMAMPMDYVIAWVMGHVSRSEGFLRLPEALWGVLTLIAGYQLCRELFRDSITSLLAMLMLSVSLILIQYSQELRFYSPFTFFSTLSTWLGLRAILQSRRRDWIVFTLSVLAGLSFHFFTGLVMVTVFLWVVSYYRKTGWTERRNYFVLSAGVYFTAFLVSVILFGNTDSGGNSFTLFQFEGLPSFLLTGLGWKPPVPVTITGWMPGVILCITAVTGAIKVLGKDPGSLASILFYSIFVQSFLVVIMDFLGKYFIFSRQIILLTPLMAVFSAYGAKSAIEQIVHRLNPEGDLGKRAASASILFGLCFLILSIPSLKEYYQVKKTSTMEILSILSRDWRSGEPIFTDLGSERVYVYYGNQREETRALVGAITPLVVKDNNQLPPAGPAWVVIRQPLPEADEAFLRSAGFSPVYIPPVNTLYGQGLWKRP